MTMQRLVIASLLLMTAACDSGGESKSTHTRLIPTSAVHWDVVAAADRAATVNNNGLIMMR